jgi:molecular chaperone GrpE (heat shock protein)
MEEDALENSGSSSDSRHRKQLNELLAQIQNLTKTNEELQLDFDEISEKLKLEQQKNQKLQANNFLIFF